MVDGGLAQMGDWKPSCDVMNLGSFPIRLLFCYMRSFEYNRLMRKMIDNNHSTCHMIDSTFRAEVCAANLRTPKNKTKRASLEIPVCKRKWNTWMKGSRNGCLDGRLGGPGIGGAANLKLDSNINMLWYSILYYIIVYCITLY